MNGGYIEAGGRRHAHQEASPAHSTAGGLPARVRGISLGTQLIAATCVIRAVAFSAMSSGIIRVLLVADTHLGLPKWRGAPMADRFDTYQRALQPALRGEVDLVVHGGDVFFRSRVKPSVVMRAFEPLKRIADSGVPVVVVPGNHERSAIPYPLLAAHPRVHILDRPRTLALTLRGIDVAVAGFPCERDRVRERFDEVVERTGWRSVPAAVRLLCVHQTVEGAAVGPVGYVFRGGPDVIPGRAIPRGFAAVLAGHIHRHQVLTADLSGRPLAAPVFYPGSIERTSRAEDGEAKGFVTIELEPDAREGGRVRSWAFHQLAAPMPQASESPICSPFRWVPPSRRSPVLRSEGGRKPRWSVIYIRVLAVSSARFYTSPFSMCSSRNASGLMESVPVYGY